MSASSQWNEIRSVPFVFVNLENVWKKSNLVFSDYILLLKFHSAAPWSLFKYQNRHMWCKLLLKEGTVLLWVFPSNARSSFC
jgi:hypothetical protein